MFQYLLYQIAQFLVTRLPLRASYWLADKISDLHFIFSSKSRGNVVRSLHWVYNGKVVDVRQEAREVYRNFGKYLADFLQLSSLSDRAILDRLEVQGLDHIQQAFQEKRGVIAVTAHFGNWEWGAVGLSLMGYPVHALALSHENHRVNQFFVNQRKEKGVHVIPMRSSIWKVIHCLNQNEMLLLVGDRETSGNGIPVQFFGRPVYFPHGAAALSKRCGSPIVIGFMVRKPGGRFSLVFEPPIVPKKQQDLKTITQEVASRLEKTIRQYPTQWFSFQGMRECSS